MLMFTVAFVFLLLGLLLLNVGLRQHRMRLREQAAERLVALERSGNYRGLTIDAHCSAAVPVAGREYSFDDAPQLPVAGCTAALCRCEYIGLPERRSQPERRSGLDRRTAPRLGDVDRRLSPPRRQCDLEHWSTVGAT